MSGPDPAALNQKLETVQFLHDVQQVLASEGLVLSELELMQRLLADGASPRFAQLSPSAQGEVAQLLVMAEHQPAIAELLAHPEQLGDQLPALTAAQGLVLSQESLAALAQPLELDDQQLAQVVGGFWTETLVLGLAGLVIGGIVDVAKTWIQEHYKSKAATKV